MLLAALPAVLSADDGSLPPRPIADPVSQAARAWAAASRHALRCGLTRPAELSPTSALLEVNGMQWLPARRWAPAAGNNVVGRGRSARLHRSHGAGNGREQAAPDHRRRDPADTDLRTDVAVR